MSVDLSRRLMELVAHLPCGVDIWYNKWAGGDREDSYGQYVSSPLVTLLDTPADSRSRHS